MPLPAFRLLAVTEAVSWLLLIGAAVLKRAADLPEATQVMGPIHGVIFLVYAGAVLYVRDELRWPAGRTLVALFAALLPLGTYLIVERRYLRPVQVGGRGGGELGDHLAAQADR